jgi:hypothetical protein
MKLASNPFDLTYWQWVWAVNALPDLFREMNTVK